MKKHGFFFTAFRVFNFLCLPPKGFFIDKALGSVGSAVEEKLPMERLAIGDRQGLVHRGDGSEETEEGQARRAGGGGGDGARNGQEWADRGRKPGWAAVGSQVAASKLPNRKQVLLTRDSCRRRPFESAGKDRELGMGASW